MKTSKMIGPALDWSVAKCEGVPLVFKGRKWPTDGAGKFCGPFVASLCWDSYSPSTNWQMGGPLIEREGIRLHRSVTGQWWADLESDPHRPVAGPTPLIAAMRCYVASRLGDTVDVPEELL